MAYWRVLEYYFSQNDLCYIGMLRDFILHINVKTASLLFINTATNSHQ